MAHFKYLGEGLGNLVSQIGPCLTIRIPKQDGTWQTINAPDQSTGFIVGDDIGVDITDARSLRVMLADPRFAEI